MREMPHWIQTVRGKKWDITSPETYVYDAAEIAHSLSHIGRFTGHTNEFYSVCQHSLAVYTEVARFHGQDEPDVRLASLLHDAVEAFVGDVTAPLKNMPWMEGYRELERRTEKAIFAQLMPWAPEAYKHPSIRRADLAVLHLEKICLLSECEEDWSVGLPEPALDRTWMYPASIGSCRRRFMAYYHANLPENRGKAGRL